MPPRPRQRIPVCPASQLPPGGRRLVTTDRGRSIAVFNVNGAYYAIGNICPHQSGPLGTGDLTGTTRTRVTEDDRYEPEWIREGEIVRCGWHLYEFDITTGRSLFDPNMRVATYPVHVVADGAAEPMLLVEA